MNCGASAKPVNWPMMPCTVAPGMSSATKASRFRESEFLDVLHRRLAIAHQQGLLRRGAYGNRRRWRGRACRDSRLFAFTQASKSAGVTPAFSE